MLLSKSFNLSSVPNISNVHRLLEFYRALAPVCIGGPSSTTLELELSETPKPINPTIQQGRIKKGVKLIFLLTIILFIH